MKRYIVFVLRFMLIYSILSIVITSIVYEIWNAKHINYLMLERPLLSIQYTNLIKANNVNTIYLGSSKTFRQLNPILIDSITGFSKSINMGVNNLFPYRSFDYEKFISRKCDSIKYIIYEIRPMTKIGKHYDTLNSHISINNKRLMKVIQYYWNQSTISWKDRIKEFLNISRFIFYKYSGIGMARLWRPEGDRTYFKYGSKSTNGYISLEQQTQDEVSNNDYNGVYHDHKSFIERLNAKEYSLSDFKETDKVSTYDTIFAAENLRHLDHAFPNAKILFVIPPHSHYFVLPGLNAQLNYYKSKGRLCANFSSPQKYPELHALETSFDYTHLNDMGCEIYTSLIAEKFIELKK